MMVDPATAAASYDYKGKTYYFCAVGCKVAFEKNPERYLAGEPDDHAHHGHH
jgi:YHS domain-containing protein